MKSKVPCDMISNVFYNHKTVSSLFVVIDKLKTQIHEIETLQTDHDLLPPNTNGSEENNQLNCTPPNNAHSNIAINESPDHTETITNSSQSGATKGKYERETTIDDISAEIGTLTISVKDAAQGSYIGTAIGSGFSKLFLKQLHLNKLNDIESTNINDFDSFDLFDSSVTNFYAPLPPYKIAKYAILKYVNYVHVYYPIISVEDLKLTMHNMYASPREVSLHQKFVLFIIISIGLDRSSHDNELIEYNNQFKPIKYFNIAYRYLEEIVSNRSENSLQALLLVIIWILNTNIIQDDKGDLWHLCRYSMALAMELGVHRFNPDWNFGVAKNELRNRLFWTTYNLDRIISMKFGKSLSLSNQSIDAPRPIFIRNDFVCRDLNDESSIVLKIYHEVQIKPAILLINICEISGDLLETFYTPKNNNNLVNESDLLKFKDKLQNSLTNLMIKIEQEISNTFLCHYDLKIRHCIISILLHRPSPAFPAPDAESILRCKLDCQVSLDSYIWLIEHNYMPTILCVDDMKIISLSLIYCCWKTESNSLRLKKDSIKVTTILNEIAKYYPDFAKFKNIFTILSSIVIDKLDNINPLNNKNLDPSQVHYLIHNVSDPLQKVESNMQYGTNNITNGINNPVIEFNNLFVNELFKDVFKQYQFNRNDLVLDDVCRLFNYRAIQ